MFNFLKGKNSNQLLEKADADLVVKSIQEAEKLTSGEVRVFIESRCSYVDAWDRGWEVFHNLKMDKTNLKNGILIYIAIVDKQIAIVADEGIYKKVGGPQYWINELNLIRSFAAKNQLAIGLSKAILEIGSILNQHFPLDLKNDKNELPDDIVFGH